MTYTSRDEFPKRLPNSKTFYCWRCKSTKVHKVDGKKVQYLCDKCNKLSSRVLIWDPVMMQKFDKDGNLIHYSVGMFLLNEKNDLLLFLRRKYPFLYTIPAGHMTLDEDPEEAVIREVKEEVGADVNRPKLIFEGEVRRDECVGGSDIHYWYLYIAEVNKVNITLNDEGRNWGWFGKYNVNLSKVTYPVRYFLTHLGLLNLQRFNFED